MLHPQIINPDRTLCQMMSKNGNSALFYTNRQELGWFLSESTGFVMTMGGREALSLCLDPDVCSTILARLDTTFDLRLEK